ncbi:cardiolipin synthase [Kocuria sp.]|uniref:cardiolipin synthase n=1 Tax=Kocuria sp. TaxID=1871328 RepID=UPI0026DBFFC0|nr:cardiolipin synthase [Kocuria sp.]MDO4918022.1 cardiolipin synthase [Kocuria sp.]
MDWTTVGTVAYLVIDYGIKIVAIGVVPENRRPSSSNAWLMIILVLPVVGLPLFLMLGSPFVHGRRYRIQQEANRSLTEGLEEYPDLPDEAAPPRWLESFTHMNRRLTGLPCVTGVNVELLPQEHASIASMAEAVDTATDYVHVEVYIMAWDQTTAPFFEALERAVRRGVVVRVLLDQLGSRKYPGYRDLGRRFDAAGFQWRLMMPLRPLRGQWRRPDLRNHRKLVVVDGNIAFMGSQNMIDSSYLSKKNQEIGRHWVDVMTRLTGEITEEIEAVFAVDWYSETGERLMAEDFVPSHSAVPVTGPEGSGNYMQLLPSGPGFETRPNERLFAAMADAATDRLVLCSPYFIPDESLLAAVTTAAYRGVKVELFTSEKADQFMVGHAQASYYQALLEAGVVIHRYRSPMVLHTKFMLVDREMSVMGSSNMDMRSMGLNYEISLISFGGDMVPQLEELAQRYRDASTVLTAEQWKQRGLGERYLNSVFRLTSALM